MKQNRAEKPTQYDVSGELKIEEWWLQPGVRSGHGKRMINVLRAEDQHDSALKVEGGRGVSTIGSQVQRS